MRAPSPDSSTSPIAVVVSREIDFGVSRTFDSLYSHVFRAQETFYSWDAAVRHLGLDPALLPDWSEAGPEVSKA